MAEGLCSYFKSDIIDAYSAGIEKHGLNPYAVKVMREIGIDISNNTSKTVFELDDTKFDFVVTVCGHAHETCPHFPAKTAVIHKGFDDPPFLSKDLSDEEEKLQIYRRVRDEIKDFILSLPEVLY